MEWGQEEKVQESSSELPTVANKAKERHFSSVDNLNKQRRKLTNRLHSQGMVGEEKNRLLVPVIEEKFRHQKAIEAIDSEWKTDIPKKGS